MINMIGDSEWVIDVWELSNIRGMGWHDFSVVFWPFSLVLFFPTSSLWVAIGYIPVSVGSKRYINHPKDRHLLYNYISVGFHDFILIVIHFPCFGGLGIWNIEDNRSRPIQDDWEIEVEKPQAELGVLELGTSPKYVWVIYNRLYNMYIYIICIYI